MKQYMSFFKIRFQAGLQYRAAAWAGMVTQFAWGGMNLLMYWAFYKTGKNSFPMEFSQLSGYLWLQQALLAMFMTWYFDDEIFEHISNGAVCYELCRPCDLYTMWFVKNMAVRISRAVLRCGPILLVASLLPDPFGLRLPVSFPAAVLFLVALILGFLVLVAFSMLVYISAFYTLSPKGIRILVTSLLEFLAGGLIPIPFFPEWMQPVMYALPFASMQTTPFLIYVGNLPLDQALERIGLQFFWLVALLAVGKLTMRSALKKVVVQGG